MLTPIRVRGRRKKRPAPTDDAGPRPKRPKRRGGRRLLSFAERYSSYSQSQAIKRARYLITKPPKQPRKQLSRLETLPVELIEKIFLQSLNVNLPRASASLAATVSSERIYRALILLAFWNDVPSATGPFDAVSASAITKILRPLDYIPLDLDERGALQSAILRCKWCTVQRLQSRFPDLMGLSIQRYWFSAGISMAENQEEKLRRFLAREEDDEDEMRSFEGTDKDNNHYTLTVSPLVSVTVTCHETETAQTHRILGITEFPERLLRGGNGFASATIAFLETLRLASGFNTAELMETHVALSRDVLQKGIHAALVEHNAEALTSLLKIDEYHFRCRNTNVTTANSVPYTLPAEHFRTAVRVARNKPALFQLLVRACAESVPADDSDITQWAMDLGDSFGRWLLDLMLQLPQRIKAANANPAEGAVFYLGRANGQVELARRYLNEVLGVEELGSWMEETSHDFESQWKAL
ncbi:hypothetical protein ABOM_001148 [Aspergillus bombycis]|uniref:Uncharacterized protein n=1 Tax=Aspergillus bombycis TaxID=109264 RepID=A0A1F8AEQ4_9EURO|nr:hypothetical protein ABOM_001148 [Aspergillus bombycis]OGM50210.1 hypothetical protein ABOM_001148 [Aspergillus bombycis]